MIQRIQTVWLLLSVLLFGALFIFPVYEYVIPHTVIGGLGSKNFLSAKSDFLLLIPAIFCVLLPAIAVFMFKDRKKQKNMVWLSILAACAFIALMLMQISSIKNGTPPPQSESFSIPGAAIPVLGIVLLFLAKSGINKDEKLVRSMDRLR